MGDARRIEASASDAGIDLAELGGELVDVPEGSEPSEVARRAVDLVRGGRAGVLMKGKLETAELLRAVLNRESGLRNGELLTHVALLEVPRLDRLLYISDGGVVLCPTLQQKLAIVRNAVAVAHALGLAEPKVAILAASELVQPEVATSVDAAALSKMSDRGQIRGAVVDGPLGLDNAVSAMAAETKGIGGPVAGRADVLIVPGVETGNLMTKMITFLAGGRMAGIVVGARAPVVIASRADPHAGKLYSLALGVILACRGGSGGLRDSGGSGGT